MSSRPATQAHRTPGRREANRAATTERLRAAAGEAFDRLGYVGTTTSEVASAAGIGAGTLFNYAATKPELLFLVLNERLAEHVTEARTRGQAEDDPLAALISGIEPLARLSQAHPELTAVFLREVLFGEDGPHRTEALALVDQMRQALALLLERFSNRLREPERVDEAARLLFALAVSELIARQTSGQREDALPIEQVVAARLDLALRGVLV